MKRGILALLVISAAVAQDSGQARVAVPFVGCPSDGQMGPQTPPKRSARVVRVDPEVADALAYYGMSEDSGVLAPRGWHCFVTYGSGGQHLFVSPDPVNAANLFSDNWRGFVGVAVQMNHSLGYTSGSSSVAEIIARALPAYLWFAESVQRDIDPERRVRFGPNPGETLTYKSDRIVEYTTPAQHDGLGTFFGLKKNNAEIKGVAILAGRDVDLYLLATRLPPELGALLPAIVNQVEHETAQLPPPLRK